MAANGKVVTGFSKPYVALYSASGTNVTYSKGMPLARGVSVSINPEVGDENIFYADNSAAETAPGVFNSGTATLEVDGLLTAAERLVLGLPEPVEITAGVETVKVTEYGDNMSIPYVGIGFIVRYQSDGVVTYAPMVLTKTRFNVFSTEAATQEEEIDWQTQELTSSLMRDDTANRVWKRVAEDQTSELVAEDILKYMLGITDSAAEDETV